MTARVNQQETLTPYISSQDLLDESTDKVRVGTLMSDSKTSSGRPPNKVEAISVIFERRSLPRMTVRNLAYFHDPRRPTRVDGGTSGTRETKTQVPSETVRKSLSQMQLSSDSFGWVCAM